MTIEELISSIHSLESYLQKFEEKYKLRSEDFYKLVKKDKLEHTPDFVEWLGVYELKEKREQKYHKALSNLLQSQQDIELPLNDRVVSEV